MGARCIVKAGAEEGGGVHVGPSPADERRFAVLLLAARRGRAAPRSRSAKGGVIALPDHIKLDADESDAVIGCLVRAAEVGEGTGNLDLMAMAEHLVDLIIEKWLKRGDTDA